MRLFSGSNFTVINSVPQYFLNTGSGKGRGESKIEQKGSCQDSPESSLVIVLI